MTRHVLVLCQRKSGLDAGKDIETHIVPKIEQFAREQLDDDITIEYLTDLTLYSNRRPILTSYCVCLIKGKTISRIIRPLIVCHRKRSRSGTNIYESLSR